MTAPVLVRDPTHDPEVDVNWTTGLTSVALPAAIVNIPIGVGLPGRDGQDGVAQATPRPTYTLTGATSWSMSYPVAGRQPVVVITDALGRVVETDVEYSGGSVFVSFPSAFTGTITLA